MAGFTPVSYDQLRQSVSEAYTAQATLPANDNQGSTVGSVFNATAFLGAQLQQGLSYLAAVSRLATSLGVDVDSFVNPFGVTRLSASPASGQVTLSAPSPVSSQLVIPIGTVVQTASGIQFVLSADNAQSGYNAALNGYIIPAGQTFVNGTVICAVAGSQGNVQANQITQIYSGSGTPSVAGISSVTNGIAFLNGLDTETDALLIARFTLLESSGRAATPNALAGAVLGVQTNLTYSIGDQLNSSGGAAPGTVTIPINVLGQAVGPSAALIAAAQSAVNAVRAAGITCTVIAPTLVPVNVSARLVLASGAIAGTVNAAAAVAYAAYVNGIGLSPIAASTMVSLARIYALLLTVPGVSDVQTVLLNTTSADVVAAFANQVVAGSSTFTN